VRQCSKPPTVKNLTFIVPRVSGFSLLLSSLARFTLTLPSLPLTLINGVQGYNPWKNFEIMLACRQVLALFGRKNPVFDEPTKSSPPTSAKYSPYFSTEHLLQALRCVDAPVYRSTARSRLPLVDGATRNFAVLTKYVTCQVN
jgi:hypothetical protein